jgi:beta-phosphoglucomutase-like phosphatase (HAD superfamily)
MEGLMKKIEGIIFDMDGTLFDTERVSFKIWQEIMKKHGYSMSKEVYVSLMGRKRNDVNKILLKLYGKDFPVEKIRYEKEVDMHKFIEEKGVPVKEGAFELLDFLVENRYKIALATSTSRERALNLLKMVGIKDRFSVTISIDEKSTKARKEKINKLAEDLWE